MADADIKAEMKKAVLELQSLGLELNGAVEQAAANIERLRTVISVKA